MAITKLVYNYYYQLIYFDRICTIHCQQYFILQMKEAITEARVYLHSLGNTIPLGKQLDVILVLRQQLQIKQTSPQEAQYLSGQNFIHADRNHDDDRSETDESCQE